MIPAAATVDRCCLYHEDGSLAFYATLESGSLEGEVSHALLRDCSTYFPHITYSRCAGDKRLIGFDIRMNMRIILLDALRYSLLTGQPIPALATDLVCMSSLQQPWLDPYHALVPSEARNEVSLEKLCQFLEIGGADNLVGSASNRADLARRLALTTGATGVVVTE